jgi:hypothetical protein
MPLCRLLKKVASFVLTVKKILNVPQRVRFRFFLCCGLADGLFLSNLLAASRRPFPDSPSPRDFISLLYETYASGKIGNTYCAQFGPDRFFCFSSSNNYAVCRLRRPSKKFLSSHPHLP